MNSTVFAVELALNRTAFDGLREKIRQSPPGQYAAIAQGRLISLASTFEEAVAAIERLQPRPEHFLVFPVDEEPAFEVIDDFSHSL